MPHEQFDTYAQINIQYATYSTHQVTPEKREKKKQCVYVGKICNYSSLTYYNAETQTRETEFWMQKVQITGQKCIARESGPKTNMSDTTLAHLLDTNNMTFLSCKQTNSH